MGMPDKPPRKGKTPRQLAVVDQHGCTGCEVCIVVCPVDCLEIAPGVEYHDAYMKLIEVDYERCIGCSLCAQVCPWDTIDMLPHAQALQVAPQRTLRTIVPGQTAGTVPQNPSPSQEIR